MELYRGRLVDHVHLVVRDLAASRRFYGVVLEVLGIPIGGEAADYFWADELFVSEQTVKNHMTSVLRKLNATDRVGAILHAVRQGWMEVAPPAPAGTHAIGASRDLREAQTA